MPSRFRVVRSDQLDQSCSPIEHESLSAAAEEASSSASEDAAAYCVIQVVAEARIHSEVRVAWE